MNLLAPYIHRHVILFSLLLISAFPGLTGATDAFTIAVVPQMPPVAMHTNWSPLVALLAKETGLNLKLKVYEKMKDFEQDLQDGKPDFIFSSPTQIVLARQSQGYIPLIRSSKKIKGVLFVRKDSSITRVKDLEGKNIAFVGAKNLWSIFVRHGLSAEQPTKIKFNRIYAGSSENVFMSVILGKADAGATLDVDVNHASAETSELLRPLMTTDEISPHPLSAHPRLPETVRLAFAEAMLRLGADPSGEELLRTVRMPFPVTADYGRDYQGIEEIDIRTLAQEE